MAGLLVQWRGFKNFSGSLKSCQKVERVRSENSAGLGSAGVLLRGVEVCQSILLITKGKYQNLSVRMGTISKT